MKLGRYEVVRELGKGAMGIVYLARDPLIGRMVALKTIRTSSSPDDEIREFKQRFVREAQAAGVLSHPAIVTVHDIGEDTETGTSFIAMEYVEGPNLKEILNQGTVLPFDQIASVIAQVAEALDFAHSKGIVHRDVKPANIIWCGEAKVKITDFGIAKIASSVANLTSTGQFLGTPNYMAPEQIKGAPVDGRSDLFSLGIVLYELLTRKKPFGGDSLTTISYRIVHEPFPKLQEVNPVIPAEFEEIIEQCLAKDPKDRYQRGLEMARSLENVVRSTKGLPGLEPLLADATVLTRQDVDHEKIPTMEMPLPEHGRLPTVDIPFPEAEAELRGEREKATAPGKNSRPLPVGPILRRRISPPLFFGILLVLLAAVGVSAAMLWSSRVPTPRVDVAREKLIARQKELRAQGNALLDAGNVEAAYGKFQELSRIAPRSPEVISTLAKLDSLRGEQLTKRQRLATSLEKLDTGKKAMEKKDFERAIALFIEAAALDPTSQEAMNLLRIAQLEQQRKQEGAREKLVFGNKTLTAAAMPIPKTAPPQTPVQAAGQSGSTALQVVFNSPVAEGYVVVKLDGQIIVHENLFEQRKGVFQRKVARRIRVTREVRARSSELQIWVVIPSWNLEPKVLRHTFTSGNSETLTLTLDQRTRQLTASVS